MPRHVTAVTVTQGDPDAYGYEPWLVEWTWKVNGRDDHCRHEHDSRAAARRHVKGLLADIEPGMSRDDVLTLHIRDEPKVQECDSPLGGDLPLWTRKCGHLLVPTIVDCGGRGSPDGEVQPGQDSQRILGLH